MDKKEFLKLCEEDLNDLLSLFNDDYYDEYKVVKLKLLKNSLNKIKSIEPNYNFNSNNKLIKMSSSLICSDLTNNYDFFKSLNLSDLNIDTSDIELSELKKEDIKNLTLIIKESTAKNKKKLFAFLENINSYDLIKFKPEIEELIKEIDKIDKNKSRFMQFQYQDLNIERDEITNNLIELQLILDEDIKNKDKIVEIFNKLKLSDIKNVFGKNIRYYSLIKNKSDFDFYNEKISNKHFVNELIGDFYLCDADLIPTLYKVKHGEFMKNFNDNFINSKLERPRISQMLSLVNEEDVKSSEYNIFLEELILNHMRKKELNKTIDSFEKKEIDSKIINFIKLLSNILHGTKHEVGETLKYNSDKIFEDIDEYCFSKKDEEKIKRIQISLSKHNLLKNVSKSSKVSQKRKI